MGRIDSRLGMSVERRELWAALLHALPVILVVLSLFYYWFAIADRYFVFLYYHNRGQDSSPFSEITSSRYWMTGLVAGGLVMILYAAASWLLSCLKRDYQPPDWWSVWAVSAIPLLCGIPLITMTMNEPTLPFSNAAQVTLAALISLAFALMPGKIAAERLVALLVLALEGVAMAVVIQEVAMMDRFVWLLASGMLWYLAAVALGLVGAAALLLLSTRIRIWRNMTVPMPLTLFVAGLCIAYLLLPFVHYIGFTNGYYYISVQANFFSWSRPLQIVAWLVAAGVAIGVTRMRSRTS
jgi:hypothetical protein